MNTHLEFLFAQSAYPIAVEHKHCMNEPNHIWAGDLITAPTSLHVLCLCHGEVQLNINCNVPNTGAENLVIIFEFSPWVLKICPEDGLKVRHNSDPSIQREHFYSFSVV